MSIVHAPWTEKQVACLVAWQESSFAHSYTCPNRSDVLHGHQYGDIGGLKPTTDGWVCLDCDYTQDWAHDFSLAWEESGHGWQYVKPRPDGSWTITLNSYQRNNLLALFNYLGYPYGNRLALKDCPLMCDTGDWFGEIANMLGGELGENEPHNGPPYVRYR